MQRITWAVLAIGIFSTPVPRAKGAENKDDLVSNPMYAAWANHKPGATATLLETTSSGDEKNPTTEQKTVIYKLLSVSDEKVVVEAIVIEQELLGTVESAPTKHTFPAKLKKSHLAVAAPELSAKKGEDTIKWMDKDVKCMTLTGSYKKDGETVEFKFWSNDEVPGGIVKRTRTTKEKDDTITTTIVLQSYKAAK